jgi:hypothetical protein
VKNVTPITHSVGDENSVWEILMKKFLGASVLALAAIGTAMPVAAGAKAFTEIKFGRGCDLPAV